MSSADSFTLENFLKKLRAGNLQGVRCRKCKQLVLPPSPVCPNCLSDKLRWVELPEEGRVVTFSEVHVANDDFKDDVPYIVSIVELEDGSRIAGTIRGLARKDLRVGTRVKVNVAEGNRVRWRNRPRIQFVRA